MRSRLRLIALLLLAGFMGCGDSSQPPSPEAVVSLTEQLRVRRERSASRRSDEAKAMMDRITEEMNRFGVMERSLKEGGTAPDFTLPSADGDSVRLNNLLARGPVVVSFYRGGWCPYCCLEFTALERALPEIEKTRRVDGSYLAGNPGLINIHQAQTTDIVSGFKRLRQQNGTGFRPGFTVPQELQAKYSKGTFNIPAYNGDDSWELPLPDTFVIDSNGIAHLAFADNDYTKRLDPIDILAALREIVAAKS